MKPLTEPPIDPNFDNVPTELLPFREAAARWYRAHKRTVTERTRQDRLVSLRSLVEFFQDKPLRAISRHDLAAFQDWRLEHCRGINVHKQFPGHRRTDMDCGVLRLILKYADVDLWEGLKRFYKPLPRDPEGPGQALSYEELTRLIEIARSDPRWFVALQCMILSANTTCGPGELRQLRLRDLDLQERKLCIKRGVKNTFRVRELPLNDAAFAAAHALLERAKKKGACLPDHYLLPGRQRRGHLDPEKPMGSWKHSWRSIQRAFASEFPHRAGLRYYDLRHTSITHLLANPLIAPQVACELAGWSNLAMARRYSHQSEQAKRSAVSSLGAPSVVSSTAAPSAPAKFPPSTSAPASSTISYFWQLKG